MPLERKPASPSPRAIIDRGVALPFTTPVLTGAKARPGAQGKVELIVPNPSGAKGYYVLELASLGAFWRITLHDELLVERIAEEGIVTPASVRRAANEIAMTGAAGREASVRAGRLIEREDKLLLVCNSVIVLKFLRQAGEEDLDWSKIDIDDELVRIDIRRRLKRLAPGLGLSLDELLDTLEEISGLAVPVGTLSGEFEGRHMRSLADLDAFANAARQWGSGEGGELRGVAARVCEAADWTLAQVAPQLRKAQKTLEDLVRVVREWEQIGSRVRQGFELCDWLLDGWDEICADWQAAQLLTRSQQRAAMRDIQRMLPLQVGDEQDVMIRADGPSWSGSARLPGQKESWRADISQLFDRSRKEQLRAAVR